jgi:isoquinoline 1-oxidoreductase beta subunit
MHPLLQAFDADQRAAFDAALLESTDLSSTSAATDESARGLTRRALLTSGAGAGLVIAIGGFAPRSAFAALPEKDGLATGPLAPNAFVRIGTDNLVTIVCKHHEMGQGNTTGLATLAADELDADWALVRTEYAPSNPKLYNNLLFGNMQGTGGSSAIANSYLQMRAAGAAARTMLIAAAAETWKVPAGEIKAEKSVLSHASGKRATYGQMALAASRQPVPANPVLKTASQFTFIGKDVIGNKKATPRVDSPSKCNGSAVYTIDVKLPGLLTAVIAWPPSFGATLVSFDATDAKKVKGVTDVVKVPEGIAVVATGTWAALQGRKALKAVWDESKSSQLDSEALLVQYRAQAAQPGTPFTRPAKPSTTATTATPPAAVKTIEAVYEFPFLAHAAMEPMNCVAWLHDGQLETWSGHQFPTFDHMLAAKAAGLPMEKVTLHTQVSGGSFGRRANAYSDFTVAAVNVAVAIKGRAPVRLQYTREDDTGAGLYRPMYLHAVKVGLDGSGQVASWQHQIVGQSIMAGTAMEAMVKDGVDPTSVEGVSPSSYALPMMSGDLHTVPLAVRPLWWRSVGNTHTAYVMETMMDQLASAAGKDPLDFRLALLDKNERAANVLKLAAEKAGWGKKTMPAGMAQGLAAHESFGSFVAQVAEVSMKDGKVKVERVVCAVDCGVAVNPDVVRAQMEGCIGYALGALYYGEIEIQNGRAAQRNFDTYKSLRIYEMPVVEVHIVPSTVAPTGVGEPGVPPLAPAVANAVARLGGPQVRRLPFARAGLIAA